MAHRWIEALRSRPAEVREEEERLEAEEVTPTFVPSVAVGKRVRAEDDDDESSAELRVARALSDIRARRAGRRAACWTADSRSASHVAGAPRRNHAQGAGVE